MPGRPLTAGGCAIVAALACLVAADPTAAGARVVAMLPKDVPSRELDLRAYAGDAQARIFLDKCTINGTTPLAFGSYDPLGATAKEAEGSITLTCDWFIQPPAGGITIELSSGNGANYARYMANGGERLNYNAYRDTNRSEVWGNGASGSRTVVITPPDGQAHTLKVYGRIPKSQNVGIGNYSDSLVVTVNVPPI